MYLNAIANKIDFFKRNQITKTAPESFEKNKHLETLQKIIP